jgi:hypothetical protein
MKTGIFATLLLTLSLVGVATFNPSRMLGIFIRQPQTVSAQSPDLRCTGPEIPVGKVRDETDKFSQEIARLVFQIAQDAKAERNAAQEFMTSTDDCKANLCVSSCAVIFKACVANPDKGCEGEACPRQEIDDRLARVEDAYAQLQATRQALSGLLHKPKPSPFVTTDYCKSDQCKKDYGAIGCLKKCQERTSRDHILFNLDEARKGLQTCVTPANSYDAETSDQDIDTPVSCQEARVNGVLSEKQAQCFNNNFFCCTIKPTQ